MLMRQRLRTVVATVIVLLVLAAPASADELRVMTSGAFTAAYLALKPEFERTTGHTLVTVTTSMGAGDTSIPNRLKRREAADVVIVDDSALRQLVTDGLVRTDSRVELVRSRVGVAVKSGAPRPDISSVEGLRQALLAAPSIAVSASVSGSYLTSELFPQLGIADAIATKVKRIEVERVGSVVARGDAAIGFQQMSELLPVTGIDIVGPLPAAVQRVSVFSAGIVEQSSRQGLAAEFIRFLLSERARPVIVTTGLEPVQP